MADIKEDLKLLGTWSSPFVLRVQIALKIKCIEDYEFIEERWLTGKSELLLKSNPVYKKVPVLLLPDGNSISESLVILQYLDDSISKGNSVLPSDPYDRAMARFWSTYIDDKWVPALLHISLVKGEVAKKGKIEQVKEGVTLLEDAFVKCSKDKDFFGGENIGFVDIALGSFLQWLEVIENMNCLDPFINESNTPNLFKWAKKFCSHACVKDLTPDVDKLGEFANIFYTKLRGNDDK